MFKEIVNIEDGGQCLDHESTGNKFFFFLNEKPRLIKESWKQTKKLTTSSTVVTTKLLILTRGKRTINKQ